MFEFVMLYRSLLAIYPTFSFCLRPHKSNFIVDAPFFLLIGITRCTLALLQNQPLIAIYVTLYHVLFLDTHTNLSM